MQTEHHQLISFWKKLFGDGRGRFKFNNAPLQRLLHNRAKSTAQDVRQVHDKFGWGAKNPTKCAGAIYRTYAFMNIKPDERDPSKKPTRNIHIEHTVLASQLHKMWINCSDFEPTFFISHGITTAMSACEEKKVGVGREPNPCFIGDDGKPFLRYKDTLKDSKIWNVFTGEQVDICKYTLADHRKTVADLLKCANAPESWITSVKRVKRSNYA
jgi:hypothetical protein